MGVMGYGSDCREIVCKWCRYLLHWRRICCVCLIVDWMIVRWLMIQDVEEAALVEISGWGWMRERADDGSFGAPYGQCSFCSWLGDCHSTARKWYRNVRLFFHAVVG
jgi:hypothetical protein